MAFCLSSGNFVSASQAEEELPKVHVGPQESGAPSRRTSSWTISVGHGPKPPEGSCSGRHRRPERQDPLQRFDDGADRLPGPPAMASGHACAGGGSRLRALGKASGRQRDFKMRDLMSARDLAAIHAFVSLG